MIRRRVLLAAVVATGSVGIGARPALALERPTAPLEVDRLVQLARPATVLVRTKLKAKVTTPAAADDQAVGRALASDPAFARAVGARDEKGLFDALLRRVAADPTIFFSPTAKDVDAVDVDATGSGFVIGDGVVMTNAHVVYGADADAGKAAIAEVIGSEEDVAGFLAEDIPPNLLDQDLLKKAAVALREHGIRSGTAAEVAKTVTVERAARSGPVTLAARTTKAGADYPGEDLALLAVPDLKPVPNLHFATTEPRTGEPVYALGFPGAATFQAGTDKASQLVPSLTAGITSAVKTSEAGVPILQVDASLAPGNSGGPLFSRSGEVVGVSVAGVRSPGNFNFAIAGSKAAAFASAPTTSATASKEDDSFLLELALRSLQAGWLRVADDDIEALEETYPEEAIVPELRAELDRRRAAKEPDLSPEVRLPTAGLAVGGAAGLLLLLDLAGAGLVGTRARRRRTAGSDPAPSS